MKIKRQYVQIGLILCIITALFFCFLLMKNINQRMNESAAYNLLNTTKVIENTLENYIDKDFEALSIIGEFYKNDEYLEIEQVTALCDTMGFEWIKVVDVQENGVDCFKDKFKAADLPCYDEWSKEKTGYSDAYFGESGHLQTVLWVPVYKNNKFIGTVFGSITLSKYYSANVFTFYEGDGRTYLFDGSDGKWILRSLGLDGVSKRQDDIYSLLISSGNNLEEVNIFQQSVKEKKTGMAVFNFNGEKSYVCFMPLFSSSDWYVVTVIASDVLLKESVHIQQIIQVIFVILCIILVLLTATLATWQVHKTKEKEMKYREALFANISSNIDSVFLIYDKDSRKTVFVSDNVKRILGLDREWIEADAERLFDWCNIEKIDSQKMDFLNGILDKPIIREACVENEMGAKSRYIRLELIPADMNQEIIVLSDITKDKDIQSSLIDAMKRAEAASNAKNDFLSSMSHDIRTPMNGIVGMTAIAAVHLEDKKRVKDCLTKINEASAQLLNLINEVLDMSQIESGKIELSYEPFNLPELLQNVLSVSLPGIQQKNHKIKVHIHSMEHEQVIGDLSRLQRIVSNLISNAIKYTPDGGVITLSLQEKVPIIKGYGCYEIMVQDNGIGMSAEFQKKLFQPFEREEDVRVNRIQGTGLGMSIVKNIVSLMMGDIKVESEKNKGTTFWVTINLRLDRQESNTTEKLNKLPVLVVDDDNLTCETVTNMLYDIGMIGESASSGVEAIRKVTERHRKGMDYMAVILDWKMPNMDGIETARKIREKIDVRIPIIILTAYDWSEIEAEARKAGVDAFLTKPIYKTKLRQKMLTFVEDYSEIPEFSKEIVDKSILKGKKILLAEDNELNKEIAVELLQMLGLEVDSAENGAAAVECFKNSSIGTYDLIMMDIQMPEMNGYEATKAIRNMNRADSNTIPIVAMTADAFAKDVQAAHDAGMNEHISKPISIEYLVRVLSRFLSDTGGQY